MGRGYADKFSPVSRIFVSSKVGGNADIEQLNSESVWALHKNFKHIVNSNGETTFGLTDLEEKIVKEGDAYVFMPMPKEIRQLTKPVRQELFREMFKASSLHVGTQTNDPHLHLAVDARKGTAPLKPIVMVNHQGCYDWFKKLIDHMVELGTITKPITNLHFVPRIEDAFPILKEAHQQKTVASFHHGGSHNVNINKLPPEQDLREERKPDFNVCVFCSASTRNEELKQISKELGRSIASEGWGLITGMGKTGMMGAVVEGATEVVKRQIARGDEKRGWIGGSNLPRIIGMEGVPDYYDKLWMKDDIYKRMEIMIEKSEAFVIMPGGMGTVQELMALLLLKHAEQGRQNGLMVRAKDGRNKPIVLVNHELEVGEEKKKFWQPLVDMARQFGFEKEIIVVDTVDEAMKLLKDSHKRPDRGHAAA